VTQPIHPSLPLVDAFREMAAHVHASDDFEVTFARISTTAAQTISGCNAASISTIEEKGPVSHGITDQLAELGDKIQYEENEGPCLDAAMEERWIYTPDMAAASARWPTSSRRLAGELGVASMFSCRLALDAAPNQTLGGLNLYSRTVDGFSSEDQMLAILLSSLGAVVVDASRQQATLRAAIESRQVIGEAIGILKAHSDLTSDEAFARLSQASQRMNIKLRDLAEKIAKAPKKAGI
jgi:hypothetical protein